MLNVVAEDGEAFNRSLSETIPSSLPFFMTGARRICSFLNMASTSFIGASGETEITGRDILSPTNILTSQAAHPTLFVKIITNGLDRKSTRLNSSHLVISYAVFC